MTARDPDHPEQFAGTLADGLYYEPTYPDTVTRQIHRLIDRPVRRSIIERHKLRRVPGSVYLDENGEVA